MVSAMQSGAGKTVLTCALLRALQRRGLDVAGFKCGPDYLDPLFHRRVLGTACDNLDLFLQGEAGVRDVLGSARADLGVIEGAMGFFDGVGGTDEASAWQLAAQEGIPVVLAVRPSGSSLTLAAQVRGMQTFRAPDPIAGIVLTDCKPSLAAHLRPLLERECGLPVLGCLPTLPEASFASRHLGLVRAEEVPDFERRIDVVADALEAACDLDALVGLATSVRPAAGREGDDGPARPADGRTAAVRTGPTSSAPTTSDLPTASLAAPRCRIAVARDEAFCFYYEAGLARLETAGAELVAFSPLRDATLPVADALYLGGGYPELHAARLSANGTMRQALRAAVATGMPTLAECGGFMYLQQYITGAQGVAHPMVGALPGRSAPAGRLVRFGYAHLVAERDSLLLRAGERLPVHEFHHWDSTDNGRDLVATKPTGASWCCCHATQTLHAGFPHLHLAGELPLAERFVHAAEG